MLIRIGEIGLTENSLVNIMFDLKNINSLTGVMIPAVVRRSDFAKVAMEFENLEKGIEEFINQV